MIAISLNTLTCAGWENMKRLGEYESHLAFYHEIVTKWQQLKKQNNL